MGANSTDVAAWEVQLEQHQAQLAALAGRVENHLVTTDDSYAAAGDLVKGVRALLKQVEDKRTEAKAPFLSAGRQIDAKARSLVKPLQDAQRGLRDRMGRFAADKERKRKEREAAKKKLQQETAAAAEERGDERTAQAIRGAAPTGVSKEAARGEHATTGYRTVFKGARITDVTKVPAAYLQLNEAAVRGAWQRAKGEIEIPGVEIDTGQSVVVR